MVNVGNKILQSLGLKKRDSIAYKVKGSVYGDQEADKEDMELYENLYKSVPEIFQGVNTMADNAIIAGYELNGKNKEELLEILENFNFEEMLINIAKQLLIFGNAYIEVSYTGNKVTGLDFIHPATVEIDRNDAGEVENYIQKASNGKEIKLNPEEVIHFAYNRIADRAQGVGIIQPLAKIIRYKMNTELAIATSADNYANPVQLWKFGTKEKPWAKTKIDQFLDDFKPNKSVGVAGDVDLELKAPTDQLRLDYYMEQNTRSLLAGIQVPDCLLGWGQGTTEAVARVELQGFDRRVQSLRQNIKKPIDTQLFPLIAKLKKWSESNTLKWPLTDSQELTRSEVFTELVKTGIVSADYARERLGMQEGAPKEEPESDVGKGGQTEEDEQTSSSG